MGNLDNITELTKMIGLDVNKYRITKYINSGSFGDVFEAKHKETGKLVALKIPIKNDERDGTKSLLEEARVYKDIADPDRGVVDMKVVSYKDKRVIAMDLLGPSLETLLTKHKKFGMKTITLLVIKILDVMKHIHSCGYIHRDIKPDNFATGFDDNEKIYCIDFGLSKKYINKNGDHLPFSDKRRFCGTCRYASIASHMNWEQSRKDDLESVAYMLIYMYKGKLPWQKIKHKEKREKYRLVGERKVSTTPEELCSGMSKEFLIFLKYVRNLDFDEKPHYSALKKMFVRLYESMRYKNDHMEWEK